MKPKPPAKKTAAKKAAPRKAAPRKAPAKKAAAKKAAPRKAAPKKAPARRAPAKKSTPRALRAVPDAPDEPTTASPDQGQVVPAGATPAEDEVFDPQYVAHRHHISGMPWRDIAKLTGYQSEQAAIAAVQSYLQKAAIARSIEHQQMALQTQVDRYEAIIHAWWEKATTGSSAEAAGQVLRAMAQLDRLQQFGEMDTQAIGRTIVIAGTPEEYIRQLRGVVEGKVED